MALTLAQIIFNPSVFCAQYICVPPPSEWSKLVWQVITAAGPFLKQVTIAETQAAPQVARHAARRPPVWNTQPFGYIPMSALCLG